MTVFYKGKLKRTRTPKDVFAKIRASVKPKQVTKLWTIQEDENCLSIDFGDGKSETLIFCFKDKEIDGLCKVAFDDEGGEKHLAVFFNLFYSVLKMFSALEIDDDYGLWNDFLDSKRFKIQMRELTENETARIKNLYNRGCVSHKDIIMAVITDDLNVSSVNDIDFSQNATYTSKKRKDSIELQVLEAWLLQTAAYKDRGRLAKYKVSYSGFDGSYSHGGYRWKDDYSEVSELEFALWAFAHGISALFSEGFPMESSTAIKGGFFPKEVQVIRLFKEKFIPLFIAESDACNQCILAYRFMVSVYEYCGFNFVGLPE